MSQPPIIGKSIEVTEWVHSDALVVSVVVEASTDGRYGGEYLFSPATVAHLQKIKELADAGNVAELAKHGTVYKRVEAKVPA